jgi:hypothetical protein
MPRLGMSAQLPPFCRQALGTVGHAGDRSLSQAFGLLRWRCRKPLTLAGLRPASFAALSAPAHHPLSEPRMEAAKRPE